MPRPSFLLRAFLLQAFLLPAFLLTAFSLAPLAARAAPGPAYIVIDADNGAVLADQDAAHPWYPASITKLMTAYVTFEALKAGEIKLTSPVKVSAHALAQAPSKMGFPVGTVMNVDNALKMMLVHSANDIAVAIAESVGGSEPKFVARMNATAARLGMNSTHYDNANGLPDAGQLTTARDLAVLARAIMTDFPDRADYFDIPAIRFGKRVLRSQNKLLEYYRSATGMKTGFVCASGYNVVGSAHRNGRTIIAVVLGATTPDGRNELAARLLDQGFVTLSAGKPALAAFEAAPAPGSAADMRALVCSKSAPLSEEEAAGDDGAPSALGPRVVLMDPVQVYTGRADGVPDATPPVGRKVAAGNVPLPRLRPAASATVPTIDASAFAAVPVPGQR